MDEDAALLHRVADEATSYLGSVGARPVGPPAVMAPADRPFADRLPQRLPDHPLGASAVLDELLATVDGGLVATGSPRYFGFVVGSALPVAIAADWLTSTWDQNAGLYAIGPAAAVIEETVGAWLLDLLGLPAVVLLRRGDRLPDGPRHRARRGPPPPAGPPGVGRRARRDGRRAARSECSAAALTHVTVPRALRLLGFGTASLELVDVDERGRMDPAALATALAADDRPAIVCAQLGEVNTGAMDPIGELADVTHAAGGWLHVDGAFGLWARTADGRRHLADGAERADSWATDAHKWLNVPYDAGLAFCAHPEAHRLALGAHADYLAPTPGQRDAVDWTPEFSRRARGIAIYAALRWFGRAGVGQLVDRCCDLAGRFAAGLDAMGAEVLNEVVAQPGAGVVRHRRAHARGDRPPAGRRPVLDERDDLGRPGGHEDLGGRLPHIGGRCGPHAGRCRRGDGRHRSADDRPPPHRTARIMTTTGTVLGIWAHPDDECYLSAGLMADAVRRGHRVVCVTATRGEAGVTDESRWPAAELAQIRERELAQSLRELGVKEHQFLGLADGGCADADPEPLIEKLAALMTELRPAVVVTFGPDGITDHDDHKAVGHWTTEAHAHVGAEWSQQLWYPTYPTDWEPIWGAELRSIGVYPPGFPHLVDREALVAGLSLDDRAPRAEVRRAPRAAQPGRRAPPRAHPRAVPGLPRRGVLPPRPGTAADGHGLSTT